jgi:hypothetical protein
MVQRFLESQARTLADPLIQRQSQARFTLPNEVVVEPSSKAGEPDKSSTVPQNQREQMIGGLIDGLTGADIRVLLRNRLIELEGSSDRAVAVAAGLLRYAIATYLVHEMLPSGRTVQYVAAEGEEIPTIPSGDDTPASAITADTDAIAESGEGESGRGELLVPFVPAARKFYLPQWVAFDQEGQLLVNSTQEAEAHIASMQRFLAILHTAVAIASYMVVDEEYQRKRYGILGQLLNQGRALASYRTREIVETIKKRAAANDLTPEKGCGPGIGGSATRPAGLVWPGSQFNPWPAPRVRIFSSKPQRGRIHRRAHATSNRPAPTHSGSSGGSLPDERGV